MDDSLICCELEPPRDKTIASSRRQLKRRELPRKMRVKLVEDRVFRRRFTFSTPLTLEVREPANKGGHADGVGSRGASSCEHCTNNHRTRPCQACWRARDQSIDGFVRGWSCDRQRSHQAGLDKERAASSPAAQKQNDDDNCAEWEMYICIVGGNHAALISNPPQTEWKMSATPS
jgi:hypothetical protein